MSVGVLGKMDPADIESMGQGMPINMSFTVTTSQQTEVILGTKVKWHSTAPWTPTAQWNSEGFTANVTTNDKEEGQDTAGAPTGPSQPWLELVTCSFQKIMSAILKYYKHNEEKISVV